jgi:hypothetical protein
MDDMMYEDINDLFKDRQSWLRVQVHQNEFDGFDVVLRLDGSYTQKADAEALADDFRRWIEPLLDLRRATDWEPAGTAVAPCSGPTIRKRRPR